MGHKGLEKTELGNTGIYLSPIGLGTVKFGRNEGVKYPHGFDLPSEKECAQILELCKSLGINTLDTAPAYGLSEQRLGKLLKGQRDDWVIIGKIGEEFDNGVSSHDFTIEHMDYSLARSLERLKTDYIDVLLLHSDGNDMDILEDDAVIARLLDYQKQGKVRAVGASTKTVEGGIKTLEDLDVVMATYNPAYTEEEPVLDFAKKNGKGVLLKKALASGHIDTILPKNKDPWNEAMPLDPVQYAMDFAFDHPATSSIIIGSINQKHICENMERANRVINNKSFRRKWLVG